MPSGRFCNSCGYSLPNPDTQDIEKHAGPESELGADSVPVKARGPMPRFAFTISGVDESTSATLLSRAELDIIGDELDLLIDQIGATRQALQLKEADKAVLTARAEHLRKTFDQTKRRRNELASFGGSLPLEGILHSLDEQEAKLSKLDEMQGSLDQVIFKEQKSKIKSTIKSLNKDLKSAIKDAERWQKALAKTRKELLREGSRLDAKHKIGDISTTAFESSKAEVERFIRVIAVGYKMLDEALELAKKR
ncbi:MAG: hypothetical protein ACFFAY_02300 [Promethearchaeota archaeon]